MYVWWGAEYRSFNFHYLSLVLETLMWRRQRNIGHDSLMVSAEIIDKVQVVK